MSPPHDELHETLRNYEILFRLKATRIVHAIQIQWSFAPYRHATDLQT